MTSKKLLVTIILRQSKSPSSVQECFWQHSGRNSRRPKLQQTVDTLCHSTPASTKKVETLWRVCARLTAVQYSVQRHGIYIHRTVTENKKTGLITPRGTFLPEKLTGFQLVKKFPAFYGTRRFITTFTSARHLSLSRARSIQSKPPHPTS